MERVVMDSPQIIKGLADAIPLGPHPAPHSEWIRVRLDFVQEAIDMIDWLEKGNAEWRTLALRHAEAARENERKLREALRHLDCVLNQCRTAGEQQQSDSEAREFLLQCGL